MNIPPILPAAPPAAQVFASGNGGAAMDAASQVFADILSQSQEQPLTEERAEWPTGSELCVPNLPDAALVDLLSQSALTAEDLQPAYPPDSPIAAIPEQATFETVSNMAENTTNDAAPMVDVQSVSDAQFTAEASVADMLAAQDDDLAPSSSDLSTSDAEPPPMSDHPADSSADAGDAQASTSAHEKDQPNEQPLSDGPSLQELGLESVSDSAEIDQSSLISPGDPMPDAGPSQTPSSSSSATSSGPSSAPILTQQGTPLSDHMIQVAQSAPDGPVTLTLSPDDLGTLCFEVQQATDGVSVHLTVERPETLDLLRRHADQLIDAFRQAGFSGASFTFGGGEGGQRDRPPPQTTSAWPDPIPPRTERFAVGLLDIRL